MDRLVLYHGSQRHLQMLNDLFLTMNRVEWLQVVKTMKSVREAGVDVMTLGQYMRPTKKHMPVSEFVTPEAFEEYRKLGVELVWF